MHEQLLEHIRHLERSVRRWRLACFALVILAVSLLAVGGTFGSILMLRLPDINEMEMLRMEARESRDRAEDAMHAERVARQQAETALQAERAARQQLEAKGNGQ